MTPLEESARAPERGSQFLSTKNSLSASKDRIIADLLSGLLSMHNSTRLHIPVSCCLGNGRIIIEILPLTLRQDTLAPHSQNISCGHLHLEHNLRHILMLC